VALFAYHVTYTRIEMASKTANVEIQVVIDGEGVKCVRIVGPSEEHEPGHRLYFQLRDLIDNLDKAIQDRLKGKEEDEKSKLNA
jgi:hypothetical protein